MAEIIQGEAYSVAFTLINDGVVVTDQTVDGVRIALGNQTATYPDGTLTYDDTDQTWRFPLTQQNSYSMSGKETDYQAQIRIGTNIYSTRKQKITVYDSMFRGKWDA